MIFPSALFVRALQSLIGLCDVDEDADEVNNNS